MSSSNVFYEGSLRSVTVPNVQNGHVCILHAFGRRTGYVRDILPVFGGAAPISVIYSYIF